MWARKSAGLAIGCGGVWNESKFVRRNGKSFDDDSKAFI